jgi:hypothetical protein
MNIICALKGHRFMTGGRCNQWVSFWDGEDSPQGRGGL